MDGAPAQFGSHRDRAGTWFADERGIDRRLRVSWHPDRRLLVLSVWQRDTCTATFRLPLDDLPRLVAALVDMLGQAAVSSTGPVAARARTRLGTLPVSWRRHHRRDID